MSDRQRRNTLKNNGRRFQRPGVRSPFPDVYRKPHVVVNPMKISNPRQRPTDPKYIRRQLSNTLEDPSKPKRIIQGYDRYERKRPVYRRVSQPPEQETKLVKKKKITDSYILDNEKLIQVYSPLSDKLKMSSSEDGLVDVNSKIVNQTMKTNIGKLQSERSLGSTIGPKRKEYLSGIPYKTPSYFSERRKNFPEAKFGKTIRLHRSSKESKNNNITSPNNMKDNLISVYESPNSFKGNQISVNEAEKGSKEISLKDFSNDIDSKLVRSKLRGTCGKCLKYCMVISNIIILIGSIIVISVACLSLHDQSFLTQIIGTNLYTNVVYFLIATACATILLSLLGCVGAIKEVRCILIAYFVALCILFVSIMVGALSGYLFRGHLYTAMEKSMIASIEDYSDDEKTKEAWNMIQKYLQCCGVHSVDDWPEEGIPGSCCSGIYMGGPCNKRESYEPGCLEKSYAYLQSNASAIALAYMMLIFVIVLGMVMSCSLWRKVDARKRRFKAST